MYAAYISKIVTNLESTLEKALEFISWKTQIRRDSVVFIKPNFTLPFFQEGITTHPSLLKSLINIIGNRSSRIILGESDGGNRSFTADRAFSGHRMPEIAKETGIELVNLSKLPSVTIKKHIQSRSVKVQLPKILLKEVNCFISVPVLKVHVMTGVTLGIKNLWGCYPDSMRCLHHQNLDYKLALMTRILKPKITIIDGLHALDGHGPMWGRPVAMDLIIGSNNVVVADTLGAAIMRIPLLKAKHILVAEREELGITKLDKVQINDRWETYQHHFHIKPTLLDFASRILFNNHTAAKVVMDSPFSPMIYRIATRFRTSEEKQINKQLRTYFV